MKRNKLARWRVRLPGTGLLTAGFVLFWVGLSLAEAITPGQPWSATGRALAGRTLSANTQLMASASFMAAGLTGMLLAFAFLTMGDWYRRQMLEHKRTRKLLRKALRQLEQGTPETPQ